MFIRSRIQNLARVFTLACGLAPTAALSQSPDLGEDCTLIESGQASWYGEEMAIAWRNGEPVFNPTASGEEFVPDEISAAHPDLPMGTEILVVAPSYGELVVTVNDRGPYADDRVLDLSRGAAEELGFKDNGEAFVRIYTCDRYKFDSLKIS